MAELCLVVDDSKIIRRISRQIVESLGFACEEAEDGEKALEACKKTMPRVILLDWNMPIMNGYEFLLAARQLPGGDAPTIIFCTTENEMSQILKAMEAGANEYIMKPFDADMVKDKFIQTGVMSE
jgi:two-component system chemotaxis response regulator CheY